MRRKILQKLIDIISLFWRTIPWKLRNYFFLIPIVLEGRGKHLEAFERLFKIEEHTKWVYNELALRYGNGVHIKHKVMNYAVFFINNIEKNHIVLDIGCGYGTVAETIVRKIETVQVFGIDTDEKKILQAKKNYTNKNLKFIYGDALHIEPFKVDVIVLSNVLEHIEDRVLFLTKIKKLYNPSSFLIRVPDFERDWTIPFKKEIGLNYFSDRTHFIEHTESEFRKEMQNAGLTIISLRKTWSEIWAKCESKVE